MRERKHLTRKLKDTVSEKNKEISFLHSEMNSQVEEIDRLREHEGELERDLESKHFNIMALRAELEQLRNELDVRERGIPGITVSPTASYGRPRSPALSVASELQLFCIPLYKIKSVQRPMMTSL